MNFVVGSTVDACENSSSDIAFQFNPRFKEHVVVRNTRLSGVWGKEERLPGVLPLTPGMTFELLFLVQEHSFKVAVNGKHFIEFHHRIPYQSVGLLQVDGEVSLERINFSHEPSFPVASFVPDLGPILGTPVHTGHTGPPPIHGVPVLPPTIHGTPVHTGPQPIHGVPVTPPIIQGTPIHSSPPVLYNPPVPLAHLLPQGLFVGQTIFVSGVPSISFDTFRIDLLRSHSCNPNDSDAEVALHISARRFERAVVRNSWITGIGWGTEERAAPPFPFVPGVNFDMMIRVEANRFQIAINGQHFVEYGHRLHPINSINLLQIKGDIIITTVRFA